MIRFNQSDILKPIVKKCTRYIKYYHVKIDKLIINEFLIGLIIDIHDYCNAKCKMCPYESLRQKIDQGRMDWNLYTKIVDDFSSLIGRFKFQGMLTYCNMGEPFIENHLEKYTRYAEEKGVSVYLNTNASLMAPHKIDLLINSGFKGTFNISFHAASPDLYKKIMGLDIEDAINNIQYLTNKYPAEKISFNVINYSWPDDEEEKVRKLFNQWNIDIQINRPISRAGLVFHTKKYIRRIAGCGPDRVLYQMVICHNGDVLLCCNDMSRKEIIGNLTHSTIEEVWNGTIFQDYLNKIYSGKMSSNDMICHFCEESVPFWSLRRFIKLFLPKNIIVSWRKKRKPNWGLSKSINSHGEL